MSPEQLETRFAALRQQVQDLIESVRQQFKVLDEDVRANTADLRALARVVHDIDRLRDAHLTLRDEFGQANAKMTASLEALHKRLDKQDEERQHRSSERVRQEAADRKEMERERRTGRRTTYVTLGAVMFAALANFILPLLHVGVH